MSWPFRNESMGNIYPHGFKAVFANFNSWKVVERGRGTTIFPFSMDLFLLGTVYREKALTQSAVDGA